MPPFRKLIAVIDDDVSVRTAIERQLRIAGYRCESFSCAEDFLAVAAMSGVNGIVSDVHLGGMTGLELATHAEVSRLKLPIMLISGSGDPQVEGPARAVAAAFLRKPIPPGELLDAILCTIGPPIAEANE